MIRSVFLGCGSFLPAQCVTNDALIAAHNLDSSDEWIVRRTGIRERHFAGAGEQTSDMAAAAARLSRRTASARTPGTAPSERSGTRPPMRR